MNSQFTLADLKSGILASDNAPDQCLGIKNLCQKRINYLFVVDMFNKGIDIPEIGTVFVLAPH